MQIGKLMHGDRSGYPLRSDGDLTGDAGIGGGHPDRDRVLVGFNLNKMVAAIRQVQSTANVNQYT